MSLTEQRESASHLMVRFAFTGFITRCGHLIRSSATESLDKQNLSFQDYYNTQSIFSLPLGGKYRKNLKRKIRCFEYSVRMSKIATCPLLKERSGSLLEFQMLSGVGDVFKSRKNGKSGYLKKLDEGSWNFGIYFATGYSNTQCAIDICQFMQMQIRPLYSAHR
ncbi:hypothetical protein CAEBREN_03577 [Caenorhabditis brenneri]|uniref:Uncharacterized protein n=1 Tax=Caenorhabditis brenneri TaxID=135651 RepID=G0N1R5_CAEBE|nr:hypothetical protein CAEBREN_03577 [Caenorhabditis brenneri]